jgi:hypothetical protein
MNHSVVRLAVGARCANYFSLATTCGHIVADLHCHNLGRNDFTQRAAISQNAPAIR